MIIFQGSEHLTASKNNYAMRITHFSVCSTIHKLQIHLLFALNRANRHSVEFEPLAALRGEQGEPRGEQGEQGERGEAT